MALSNILREPRREVTETVVGLVPVSIWLAIVYFIACALYTTDNPKNDPFILDLLFSLIITSVGSVLPIGAVFLTHAIGENICNKLQQAGIHLRPKKRVN